uniref:HTH_Tnp_Tc3_1 domain-containing protein n=1 Tax=Steinernema glaseri TaxID=37863 RepID=A0A1I8A068_9BILA
MRPADSGDENSGAREALGLWVMETLRGGAEPRRDHRWAPKELKGSEGDMPKGIYLSVCERDQISGMRDSGLSIAEISRKLVRSRHVISDFWPIQKRMELGSRIQAANPSLRRS